MMMGVLKIDDDPAFIMSALSFEYRPHIIAHQNIAAPCGQTQSKTHIVYSCMHGKYRREFRCVDITPDSLGVGRRASVMFTCHRSSIVQMVIQRMN